MSKYSLGVQKEATTLFYIDRELYQLLATNSYQIRQGLALFLRLVRFKQTKYRTRCLVPSEARLEYLIYKRQTSF